MSDSIGKVESGDRTTPHQQPESDCARSYSTRRAGVSEKSDGPKKILELRLKYLGKTPLIRSLTRISTPGRRVYKKASELKPVLSGQGIAVLSTSAGLMSNRDARKRKLGGEVLCEIN